MLVKEKKFYKGYIDGVFKSVFLRKGNEESLKKLLEVILEKEVIIKKILPTELTKTNIYEKGKTLDVLIEYKGDEIMSKIAKDIVEINEDYDYLNFLNTEEDRQRLYETNLSYYQKKDYKKVLNKVSLKALLKK